MWHDITSPVTGEYSEYVRGALSKDVLIAYHDYSNTPETFRHTPRFLEAGMDFVTCPWEARGNISKGVEVAKENKLFGIMYTTWHSLFRSFGEVIYMGELAYGGYEELPTEIRRFHQAEIARKAMFSDGDYEIAGWSEKMTGPGLM